MSRRHVVEAQASSSPSNYIVASVNNVYTRILVDTGASRSCISEALVNKIGMRQHVAPIIQPTQQVPLRSATGSRLNIVGSVELNVRVHHYLIPQTFTVVRKLQHMCICGIDMLQACKAIINVHEGILSLFDDLIRVPMIMDQDHSNTLRLVHQIRMPACSK